MGDPEKWPQVNGLSPEGSSSFSAAFDSAASKDNDWWAKADLRTAELIKCIQPTQASEERRQAVIKYVQRLILKRVDCKVFTFGSVPLKTYLPDGDIDLTAFTRNHEAKSTWIQDVHNIFQIAEQSQESEFRVTDVQLIHAEVKIIKCLVANIVVDISFNQLGGVCTLCFLEEVDRLIGRNHLFKRSVIFVKAWCYYESRILGAYHGLISTYALETLVLYIFNVFHSSLHGPLQVLYIFLEFFSNFDWDKYCVSLWGPVPLAFVPKVAAGQFIVGDKLQKLAEPPQKVGGELLLTKAFLAACSDAYGVVAVDQDAQSSNFNVKSLNVCDPLRPTNNIGRSVSIGNFYRIRSAFKLGARKLARIINCSEENFAAELDKFFECTLGRNRSRPRPDAADSKSWHPWIFKLGASNLGHKDVNISVNSDGNGYHAGPPYLQGAHYAYKPRPVHNPSWPFFPSPHTALKSQEGSNHAARYQGNHATQSRNTALAVQDSLNVSAVVASNDEKILSSKLGASNVEAKPVLKQGSIKSGSCHSGDNNHDSSLLRNGMPVPGVDEKVAPKGRSRTTKTALESATKSSIRPSSKEERKALSQQEPCDEGMGTKGPAKARNLKLTTNGKHSADNSKRYGRSPSPVSGHMADIGLTHGIHSRSGRAKYKDGAESKELEVSMSMPGGFSPSTSPSVPEVLSPSLGGSSECQATAESQIYPSMFFQTFPGNSMYNPFPYTFTTPWHPGGALCAELMSRLQANGSMEASNEIHSDHRLGNSGQSRSDEQVRVGVLEKLRAPGIPGSTGSKRDDKVVENINEGTESIDKDPDLLTSDFGYHLDTLAYGRYCQSAHSRGAPYMPPATSSSAMYVQTHRSWEGPGRPNAIVYQPVGFNPVHPLGLEPAPFVFSQKQVGSKIYLHPGQVGYLNHQQQSCLSFGSAQLAPRPRGTGTYFPNPGNYRGRQSGRGRGQHGSYSQQDCSSRAGNREGIQPLNQELENKQYRRAQSEITSAPERRHNTYRPQQHLREERRPSQAPSVSFTSSELPISSTSIGNIPVVRYCLPSSDSSGGISSSLFVPPDVVVYPVLYDSSMHVAETCPELSSLAKVVANDSNHSDGVGEISSEHSSSEHGVAGPPVSSGLPLPSMIQQLSSP